MDRNERYTELIQAASTALGLERYDPDSRRAQFCTVRFAVALKLSQEGWSEAAIGRVLGRDHATVHHMKVRMRDMLSLPGQYPEAAEIWRTLNGKSDDTDERDI